MTHMEIYQDGIRCHTALAKATAELADTAKSLLNAVELAVGYQHERDELLRQLADANAIIARVDGLAVQWWDDPTSEGQIDAAEALRAALAEPTE